MIPVDPVPLLRAQQVHLDEGLSKGRKGQRLEAQHRPFAAVNVGWRGDSLQVLDPDAIGAFPVVAGLVRHDHARLQRRRIPRLGNPLRPLMDAKIDADPMARSVVIVETGLPQRVTRQRVQVRARRAVRKANGRQGNMAFQNKGVVPAHLCTGCADRHGTGDVRRPVEILRARIDKIERAGFQPPIARDRDPVVRQGTVRPRAGNRVEGQILHLPQRLAEPLKRKRRIDLGHLARLRLGIEPVEKPRDGHPVAQVRRARAGKFGRILARLGQKDRIGSLENCRPCRLQLVEEPGRGGLGIEAHGLPVQPAHGRDQFGLVANGDLIAEMAAQVIAGLAGMDKELGGAVRPDNCAGKRKRRAGHIPAADIQQPCDRGRRGKDGRRRAVSSEFCGNFRALVCACAAGLGIGMGRDRRERLVRTIGPGDVDRIAVKTDQSRAGPACGRFQPGGGAGRHELGVIAEPGALEILGFQPAKRAWIGHGHVFEKGFGRLVGRLDRVPAIDEQHGPIGKDPGCAGRAGKAGRPGQAFIGLGQVFVLEFVLVGDKHPVQAHLCHGLAQLRQVAGRDLRAAANVEILSHGVEVAPLIPAGKGPGAGRPASTSHRCADGPAPPVPGRHRHDGPGVPGERAGQRG